MNILRKFDSFGAFLAAANGKTDMPKAQRASRDRDKDGWAGGSWEQANKLADSWSDMRPEVLKLTDAIAHDIRPHLQETFGSFYDVSGGAVDIGRFMEGEPECMMNLVPVRVAKPGRVISLLVSTVATSSVYEADMRRRGAAICALVETLEVMQHSTEIWVESSVRSRFSVTSTYTVLVKVKSADEILDMDRVMFALAHPSMLRRLVFSLQECENASIRSQFGFNPNGGYGVPINLTQAKAVDATLPIDKITSSLDPTIKASDQWIRNHLTEWALIDA